jgi:hypothetical protein
MRAKLSFKNETYVNDSPTRRSVRKTKRIIKQPLLCFYQKHHSKLRPSWTQCMEPVCKTEAAKVSHDLDLTTGAWQGYLNNVTDEFHMYFGRANVRPQTQPPGKIDHLTVPLPSFDGMKCADRRRQSDGTLFRLQALFSLSHLDRT